MKQSMCHGSAYMLLCKVIKSRYNFISVRRSVQYSRNNFTYFPINIHACRSID